MMSKIFPLLTALFLSCAGLPLAAAEWHVSPSGSDANTGTSEAEAFATLDHATTQLYPGDTLVIHGGTYREPLRIRRSGSPGSPVTIRAAEVSGLPELVTISGFDLIAPGVGGMGQWQLHSGAIWKIQLPAGWGLALGRNLVQVDGEVLRYARWPDATDTIGFDRREMAEADSGSIDLGSMAGLDPVLAGRVPAYSYTDFYTGIYVDSDLSGFVADEWVGAHVDLCPGHNWWPKTAVVTGNSGTGIAFQYRFEDGWDPVIDTPKNGDRYALWGHLRALDSPGEFFLDVHGLNGPAGMLYLWLPDGGSPVGRAVAVLDRETSVDLASYSHIHLRNIRVDGGAVVTGTGSTANIFEGVEVDYGSLNRSSLAFGAGRAVWLRGGGHRFADGRVGHSFRRNLEVAGAGTVVENNVLHDSTEHLLTLAGASNGVFRRNTGFSVGGTAIDIGTSGSVIEHNHVYHAGMRITDIATLNTWNGGDLGGTEIRYNWVHSNLAPRDSSRSWWGGQGIRLDSGGSTLGCSNVLIHHNVVWGTSAPSSITVWGLEAGMLNYGNAQVRVYHNTVADQLVLGGSGSVAGNDWQRNLARAFNNSTASLTGATIAENQFVESVLAGNWTGVPGFVSSVNHNYQLRADSTARDAGTPIAGVSESGPEAYLGAYNPAADPWRPGARLRPQDLPELQAEVVSDSFGQRRVRIHGLPRGRTFPDAFVLRVGGRTASSMVIRYEFFHDIVEGLFAVDLVGLAATVPVECSLDGVSFAPLSTSLTVREPAILGVTTAATDAAGGTDHEIAVDFLQGSVGQLVPLDLSGLLTGDFTTTAVPVVVDTAAWIADGMAADASDLRILDWDGDAEVRYHIESGLGESNTLLWLMAPAGVESESVISFEDRTRLHVAYGDPFIAGSDDPDLLIESFPALGLPQVLLHLRANTLQTSLDDGDPVSLWPDRNDPAHDAEQADALKQPLFSAASMGGLPAIVFDGINDVLDVNGAAGLGTGPCRIMVVYRAPDPGTVKWQRVYSARASSSMLDYVDGLYAIVENVSGTPIILPDPFLRDMNFSAAAASRENFRIGGRSLLDGTEQFKGEIAEIIGFDGGLTGTPRDQVIAYLKRKYNMSPRPVAAIDSAGALPGLEVRVGGVAAGDVHWTVDGKLAFTAPAYAGIDPLPATVELSIVLPDGTEVVLPEGFRYRSPFESWQASQFGESAVADPELESILWGASADPDADGLDNFSEYALGGDAQVSTVSPHPRSENIGGRVHLNFERARPELRYEVQGSDDLATWSEISVNPGSVGEVVSVPDSILLSESPEKRRFLRLQISD